MGVERRGERFFVLSHFPVREYLARIGDCTQMVLPFSLRLQVLTNQFPVSLFPSTAPAGRRCRARALSREKRCCYGGERTGRWKLAGLKDRDAVRRGAATYGTAPNQLRSSSRKERTSEAAAVGRGRADGCGDGRLASSCGTVRQRCCATRSCTRA